MPKHTPHQLAMETAFEAWWQAPTLISKADARLGFYAGYTALAHENELLRERLKAIADPEHCLTRFTADGLRQLAREGLEASHA